MPWKYDLNYCTCDYGGSMCISCQSLNKPREDNTMDNEQKAKRLEEMAAGIDRCAVMFVPPDAALLRECAAILRERDGVRWVDSMFGYSVCIYRGYAICAVGYEGWHAFNRVKDQYEKGFFPTLDAAKAAAVAWVDAQEGK